MYIDCAKNGTPRPENGWLGEEFVLVLAEAEPVDVVQRRIGEHVHHFVDHDACRSC